MAGIVGMVAIRILLQPILSRSGVASLYEMLTLCTRFNQPVQGLVWPSSLEKLTFGL